uniref:(3R)-3-hydroxyacyl-CoA dehydrogenase n=1 Tax=Ixodes ricinus TaxID=34613 RepID=A0A131Y1E3_IXORI
MSLSDRLAIVTGGGGGIGKAVCHALARDGAVVVVADMNFEAAKATVAELKGKDHVALYVDVGDSTSVATLMNNVGSQFRTPLSIVVNCAGVAKWRSVVDTTEFEYDVQLRVNLKGTFLVNQAAVKAMLESKVPQAAIVNIASIVGKCGFAGLATSAASKGGVIAFTKSLAQELAGTGIRVNVLLPGGTHAPLLGVIPENVLKAALATCPMRRFAQPEEVADVARYLCTPGSSYITGTCVEVAGGMFA